MKVLVVEDDPAVARATALIVTRGGYEARVAGSGEEAIAALHDEPFGAILLDINLHGKLTGLDVAQYRNDHEAFAKIPVIIVSGMDAEDIHVASQQRSEERSPLKGIMMVLGKPMNIQVLFRLLGAIEAQGA